MLSYYQVAWYYIVSKIKYKSIVMLLLVFFYQDAKIQAQSED